MRAILIDPFLQKVSEVQIEMDEGYKEIGRQLQLSSRPFTSVRLDLRDALYLDDEGLFQPDQRFWLLEGFHSPLAGRGLILGHTSSGDCMDVRVDLATVLPHVKWRPDLRFAGMESSEEKGELFGQPAIIIKNRAKFFSTKDLQ